MTQNKLNTNDPEEVLAHFADTSDVYELPQGLSDFTDFSVLVKRLSKLENKSNLFCIYSYDLRKGSWLRRYFGASSSRTFLERLKLMAFGLGDAEGALQNRSLLKQRVNLALSNNSVAGVKMIRINPEALRMEFLKMVIRHFETDKHWNV